MYYHKLVVIFSKTASSTPYFLHIQNIMSQAGTDLNTYPTNFDKYYLKAYGILGETMDLDPNKTYDYQTAFDIKATATGRRYQILLPIKLEIIVRLL